MFGNYQNRLWILLTTTWWFGGLTAWMGVAADGSAAVEPGRLMLTALFAMLISATLRLPTITSSAGTSDLQDHWVWLLSFSANVNWLGMILLKSASLWFFVAILVLWLIGECWLGYWAWRNRRLNWFFTVVAKWYLLIAVNARNSSPSGLDTRPSYSQIATGGNSSPVAPGVEVEESSIEESSIEDSSDTGTQIRQTIEDGYDSDGRRYLTGSVNLRWDSGQSSQTVVIGFVPAFQADFEFDSETDCEKLTVRLINCTPSGIRLAVRRGEPLERAINRLDWFATEPQLSVLQGDIQQEKPPLP